VLENLGQAVQILAQETTSVTVKLRNTWVNEENSIDAIFYSFRKSAFQNVCCEKNGVENDEVYADEVTLFCHDLKKFASLKVCVAHTGLPLGGDDQAEINKCCHASGVPANAHIVCYNLAVWCDSQCVTETDRI